MSGAGREAAVLGVATALLGVLALGLWRARWWAWFVTFTAFVTLAVLSFGGTVFFVIGYYEGRDAGCRGVWAGCALAIGVVLAIIGLAFGGAAWGVYGDRRRVL